MSRNMLAFFRSNTEKVGRTDENGFFEVRVSKEKVSSENITLKMINLIAIHPDHAIGWTKITKDAVRNN